MDEAGDLSRLRDIVVPDAVPWWPLAPGWWVIIVLVLMAVGYLGFRAVRSFRASAYRREAMGLLELAQSDAEISGLLKRTAMAAFGRDEVASLSGESWCDWLQDHGGREMSTEERAAVMGGIYGDSRNQVPVLKGYAAMWVREHEVFSEAEGREVSV